VLPGLWFLTPQILVPGFIGFMAIAMAFLPVFIAQNFADTRKLRKQQEAERRRHVMHGRMSEATADERALVEGLPVAERRRRLAEAWKNSH
jgi:hypothetical protein